MRIRLSITDSSSLFFSFLITNKMKLNIIFSESSLIGLTLINLFKSIKISSTALRFPLKF